MAAQFYSPPVKKLGLNKVGKDFVIGDIHGRYDLVYEALTKAEFNEQTDRLFCVGDLIDRGSYSYHVADFLSLPFVYAIRGNHEDILLQLYEDDIPSEEKISYIGEEVGMNWWLDTDVKQREAILHSLRKLPLVIEVETIRGNVGLVHADIDMSLNWQQFIKLIEDNNSYVVEEALWGRRRFTSNIDTVIEGIGRVYVGHTVQEKVKKLGNVVAIDTGAVFNQHLTMVDMIAQTQVIHYAPMPTGYINILHSLYADIVPFGDSSDNVKHIIKDKTTKDKTMHQKIDNEDNDILSLLNLK